MSSRVEVLGDHRKQTLNLTLLRLETASEVLRARQELMNFDVELSPNPLACKVGKYADNSAE